MSRSSLKWDTLLSTRCKSNRRLVEQTSPFILKRSNSAIAAFMRSPWTLEELTLYHSVSFKNGSSLSHQFTLDFWISHDMNELLELMVFSLASGVSRV